MPHLLISGGSRGIGNAIINLFEQENYKITYLYKNSQNVYESPNVKAIKCDISSPLEVKEAINTATSFMGPIDVLIHSAGISMVGLITDFNYDDYRLLMDTNFGGLFNLTREAIPSMVSRKEGTIIAISSMWGQVGASCEALYSASKGAIDSYIKSLAKELGPSNIRVNAISPGVIDTDMISHLSSDDRNALIEETPIGRIGTPEDIAKLSLFLASESSSYITGQIVGVNGGFII